MSAECAHRAAVTPKLRIAEQRATGTVVIEVRDGLTVRTSFDRDGMSEVPIDRVVSWQVVPCEPGYVCVHLRTADSDFRICLSRSVAGVVEHTFATLLQPAVTHEAAPSHAMI